MLIVGAQSLMHRLIATVRQIFYKGNYKFNDPGGEGSTCKRYRAPFAGKGPVIGEADGRVPGAAGIQWI